MEASGLQDEFFSGLSPLRVIPVPPVTPETPRKRFKQEPFEEDQKPVLNDAEESCCILPEVIFPEDSSSCIPATDVTLWEKYLSSSGKLKRHFLTNGVCVLCESKCGSKSIMHSSCKTTARNLRNALSNIFNECNVKNVRHTPYYLIDFIQLNMTETIPASVYTEVESLFRQYNEMIVTRIREVFTPDF